jgi:hypothetical protein
MFAAGFRRKGRAQRVDAPGEDRVPGSVQAGPMMHPRDIDQQLLDPRGFGIVKRFPHPDAPLPQYIV